MKELKDFEVQAGWFQNSTYDGKTSIGKIARIQNNGAVIHQSKITDKQRAFLHYAGIHLKKTTNELNIVIPARPFMDNAKKRLQGEEGKQILLQEMLRVFEGRQTMLQAVNRLKEWLKNIIQEEIIAIQSPPLARSTVRARANRYTTKAKKANPQTLAKPLVDTGLMLAEVQGKAEIKK